MPLIHGEDGKKLSKRHGAQAVHEYRDMGYLPEAAILGALTLVGVLGMTVLREVYGLIQAREALRDELVGLDHHRKANVAYKASESLQGQPKTDGDEAAEEKA